MSDVFGKKLGNYVLLEQLGEGGMAKVYNAFDSRAERNVAIKVILPSRRSSQLFLQQFETEAKALANLTHTNIVKVFNYGIEDGQPYLVMDFIPGGTLKEAMSRPIPWQTAAAILAPIARALDYVHQQQIVHRDVKPSNILLYEDFRPMLSDFGIVKLLEAKEEAANSAIGVGVGTPEYMSPEQGMGKDVDFRADIYSLGLVFYEMVTGQKPFTADTPMAAILRHITDDLTLPSQIDRGIPKFVEDAMLRAVQKNPEDRYPSMESFAEVLEMIALGEMAPQKQIRAITRQKVKKITPRHFLMVVGVMLLGFAVLLFSNRQAFLLQKIEPIKNTPNAIVLENTSTLISPPQVSSTAVGLPTSTPQAVLSQQPDAVSGISLLGTPLMISRVPQFKEIARWGIGQVNEIRWSPDGGLIGLGTSSGIFLYDSKTKNLTRHINTEFDVIKMTFSPDGTTVVAGSLTGIARSWNVENGRFMRDFVYKKPITDYVTLDKRVNVISYSQNGKNIVVGYEDGTLNYFSIDQTDPIMIVPQYPSVKDAVISADNRFMYVSNGTNEVFVWDIASKKNIHALPYQSPINKLKLSQDLQYLFSSGDSNSVFMLDLFEERIVSGFPNLGGKVTDFDVSFDNDLIAISLNTGVIQIFRKPAMDDYSKTQLPVLTINGYADPVRSLAFSPTELVVAAGSRTNGLKIWDAQSSKDALFSLDQDLAGVNEIYFSKDGEWLATSHADGQIRVWRVDAAEEAYQFPGYLPKGEPFSPDNRFLVMVRAPERNKPDAAQIIELSSGKIVAELPDYPQDSFAKFSNDSKILITGNSHFASLWDVSTWEQMNSHGGMNAGCGQYFTPQNELLTVISNSDVFFAYTDQIKDMCATQPQGATQAFYFQKQHNILFVLGDGKLWDWRFGAIANTRILRTADPYPFSRNVFLAGDQESGWYAYVEDNKKLHVIASSAYTISDSQDDYQFRAALSPDHNLVALGSQYGSIHIWTTP